MFRRSLLLLLLSCSATSTTAQIVAPMNVCYNADAMEQDVQAYCRSVPECENGETDNEHCFMRCEDQMQEIDYKCEDYGMVCHYSHICVIPPVMLEDFDEDEKNDQGTNGRR